MRANEQLAGDELAKHLLDEFDRLVQLRAEHNVETGWTDSSDYCYLNGQEPNQSSKGNEYSEKVFDGTAVWGLDQAAAGMHSSLTSITDWWLNLGVYDASLMDDVEVIGYLQTLERILMHCYNQPRANFNVAIHETYLSDVGLGNSCLYSDTAPGERGKLIKKAFPMASVYWDVDYNGFVDTVGRTTCWNQRQIMQHFSHSDDSIPGEISGELDQRKSFDVVHLVFPRSNRNPDAAGKMNKAFASYWVCKQTKSILRRGGYDSMPYQCTRWTTRADEIYGRGPAQVCMPVIKGLNQIRKTYLRSAFKAVDPPIVADDDGFVGPFNANPRKIIWKNRGTEMPAYLESRAQFQPAQYQIEMDQQFILRCLFNDLLQMGKEKTEMSAYEVADRRAEKLRGMESITGRQMTEKLDPMVRRDLSLLDRAGYLPPAPPQLNGVRLRVSFIGPAARAQEGVRAIRVQQFINAISPIGQLKPEIFDGINFESLSAMLANIMGVDRSVLNTSEQIAMIRAERAKQQQVQQLIEAAPQVGKTVKDLAAAQEMARG